MVKQLHTYKLKFIASFGFKLSILLDLVDNLYEIYSKECKGCKERNKIKSVCDFIVLKIINYIKMQRMEKKRQLEQINE